VLGVSIGTPLRSTNAALPGLSPSPRQTNTVAVFFFNASVAPAQVPPLSLPNANIQRSPRVKANDERRWSSQCKKVGTRGSKLSGSRRQLRPSGLPGDLPGARSAGQPRTGAKQVVVKVVQQVVCNVRHCVGQVLCLEGAAGWSDDPIPLTGEMFQLISGGSAPEPRCLLFLKISAAVPGRLRESGGLTSIHVQLLLQLGSCLPAVALQQGKVSSWTLSLVLKVAVVAPAPT
jgi:hypothetical protein